MRKAVIFTAVLFLASCSPFYVMRAAYEQSKILINREDIKEILSDSTRPLDEREKLQLVLDAREFGASHGLTPKDSFTKYTKVSKDVLAWVLVASKPDSFTLKTWWFPIVGTVPYKGYFSKEAADDTAKDLEDQGYESWVRGTEAMSTLGWFNDPVLSTTLKNDPYRIVNTVIHESLHSTVWVKNHVDFNESLANFVGGKGMVRFFQSAANSCQQNCQDSLTKAKAACESFKADLTLAQGVDALFRELDTLYKSEKSREQKLLERVGVFERFAAPLHARFPRLKALASVNNAELIQMKLYMTSLLDFEAAYRAQGSSWSNFLAFAKTIADKVDDSDQDPFALLKSGTTGIAIQINDEVCG